MQGPSPGGNAEVRDADTPAQEQGSQGGAGVHPCFSQAALGHVRLGLQRAGHALQGRIHMMEAKECEVSHR